jgi:hypothetical protein
VWYLILQLYQALTISCATAAIGIKGKAIKQNTKSIHLNIFLHENRLTNRLNLTRISFVMFPAPFVAGNLAQALGCLVTSTIFQTNQLAFVA